jgi:hypothetical protein
MLAPTVETDVFAVFINGVQVRTTGDVTISESLDNLSRVAEFELAEQPHPEPEKDDPVLIQWLDYTAGVSYNAFGGTVDSTDVESDPWSYVVRCVDQLEKLRFATTSDITFTGTEGQAVRTILTAVGVSYSSSSISDSGYGLGSHVPIKWLKDTPGSQVVEELNSVFGMVLMTIGNNHVIRFPIDMPPANSTGQYRTFSKGHDADWAAHSRSSGGRDAIQNIWSVLGVSMPCGAKGKCTCQPWARAVAPTPYRGGRRVRVVAQSISSDLIQDESLAIAVVKRQMWLTNRQPLGSTIDTLYDPNIHPGSKIGLIDHTYGIGDSTRRCTVTSVDATGPALQISAICGTPGSIGTVTSGVDKVCNDTHTSVDIPGSYDPPPFDYPPIDNGIPFNDSTLPIGPTVPDLPPFTFDPPKTTSGGVPGEVCSVIEGVDRTWSCGTDEMMTIEAWDVYNGYLVVGAG